MTNMILRRDDFVKLSDGSTMFDHVLSALGVAEKHQAKVHEVRIEVNEHTLYKIFNEQGRRLVRVSTLSKTTLHAIDE